MRGARVICLVAGIGLTSPATAQSGRGAEPNGAKSQEAPVRPSSKLFRDSLAEAQKPKPTAPAADFGKAAAACAAALGPTSMDAAKVESLDWTPTVKATSPKSAWVFEQKPSHVRVFLATIFSPAGQCVVDGFAQSKGDFGAIAGEVKKQVSAATGKKLKNTGGGSPNPMSRGQGFLADRLVVSISMQDQANGVSIRVTMMQIDKSKSAFETANAAGMAAQFLPMMVDKQDTPKP